MSQVLGISNKVEHLVCDTAAFITGTRIENFANKAYTIPEVLSEVKDSRAKGFLEELSIRGFDIVIRSPEKQDLEHVIEFAKSTGDYASLSATDIKVLALTFMLERELNGGISHLRLAATKVQEGKDAVQPNFFDPSKVKIGKQSINSIVSAPSSGITTPQSRSRRSSASKSSKPTLESTPENPSESNSAVKDAQSEQKQETTSSNTSTPTTSTSTTESEGKKSETQDGSKQEEEEPKHENEEKGDNSGGDNDDDDDEGHNDAENDGEEQNKEDNQAWGFGEFGEDDDGGWITPDNIQQYTEAYKEVTGTVKVEGVKVACLTTDFSMQNVLLQMKMNLLSVDGMSVRFLHKWILRCHACYKLCKDVTKQKCPSCGGNTLDKVSYQIDEEGNTFYRLPRNKPSLRGTIYALPLPKGGRQKNSKET
eukprot:TRINITY_DN2365_c0_g2_i1.p1 TRINITY_DN2365_c0_g2~~TRINITY_DN2365_c0_g2_i1.p1  ORF type:complete len:424 (-),score=132.20 TRINITY_DN2365_c0_g2_i1:638-1909(-)